MSEQLTLELSDELYADLQKKAEAVGLSITEWIVASLSSQSVTTQPVWWGGGGGGTKRGLKRRS
jgi:hypothetical protein